MMASWQQFIWRGFRFELPSDWEMLQFGRDAKRGRCGFMDRYHMRLEFSWRNLDAAPDLERMATDYAQKLRAGDEFGEVGETSMVGWAGVLARRPGLEVSRFLRHFEAESCLVEMVFHHPDEREEAVEKAVLRSFRPEPAQEAGGRMLMPWKAYGMTMFARHALPLESCQVEPGNVSLTFGNIRKGDGQEVFSRIGLVDYWLKGDLSDWLLARAPEYVKVNDRSRTRVGDVWVEHLEAKLVMPHVIPFTVKSGHYHSACWRSSEDGRLHFISVADTGRTAEKGNQALRRLELAQQEIEGVTR